MLVLGVSAFYHDSASCLLNDGELLAAAEEERFSRLKFDSRLPVGAVRYCLKEAGASIADVDRIAYYEEPSKKLARQLWMGLPGLRADLDVERVNAFRPTREIREHLGYDGSIDFVPHHLSHAASSFHYSSFEEAAIMTVDGVGEWATATFGRGNGVDIDLFEEVVFPDSLGLFYATITAYLGFGVNDGEYKVMGLAPYGKPAYANQLREVVRSADKGQFRLDMRYFDFMRNDRMYSDELTNLLGFDPRPAGSELLQEHKDLARSAQLVLEETLLMKATYLHDTVNSKNLCLAGGVALNCVANSRILRESSFENLFVQPAANDAGCALGAAAIAYIRAATKPTRVRPMQDVFLGPSFDSDQVRSLLLALSVDFIEFSKEDDLLHATVQRLQAGDVIGWFQGRMEFGPRALGARSILADPRLASMRDRINTMVKKRESFRPFAPAVLLEHARNHFNIDHPSPFMLETCQVVSETDLPAITHIDGSARIQTVALHSGSRFARLLCAFERATQCPILLNTSFNMKDEPIVCSPLDAVKCFVRASLDTLVIEDLLVDRVMLSKAPLKNLVDPRQSPAFTHAVYSFI